MRRPRHRVKSNLLWKMLGLAALVNLLLWPVLIRLGVFTGIRREILIPVTLVLPPAPTKAPDALAKVSKAPPPVSRPTPRVVSSASSPTKRPVVAVRPPPVSVPPPQQIAQVAPRKITKPPTPAPPTRTIAARPTRPTRPSRPPRFVVAETHSETHSTLPSLVEARRERAARLEREGHQVAEQIAAERAAWRTRHRPVVAAAAVPPKPPVKIVTAPVKPPQKVAVVPQKVVVVPQKPQKVAVVPSPTPILPPTDAAPDDAVSTPAVALVKVQPSVPESMQNSEWQATFRGVFEVYKDGTFIVRMTSSTGFPVLDERALNAARKWKFRPATEYGQPVPSAVRFQFDYAVRAVP